MRGSGESGLGGIVGGTQVGALGSHVAHLREPVVPQFTLHSEVPLLGGGRNPVEWNLERDEAVDVAGKSGTTLLRQGGWIIVSQSAARRKSREKGRLRDKGGIQHAIRRDPREGGRIWFKQIRQAARAGQKVDSDGEDRG